MIGPLTTQIVGSYCKPHWLARHQRMRALDGSWWRPEPEVLADAKQDAARLAIYEQERAGIDLLTDGEAQRAAYDRHFVAALSGIDVSHPVRTDQAPTDLPTARRDMTGLEEYAEANAWRPRVVADIGWTGSAAQHEVAFLRTHTTRPVKAAVIGPMSLAFQLHDAFYDDTAALIMALAAALNQELLALQAAGADVLQIDEPVIHSRLALAREVGRAAIARMVQGIHVPVQVHVCYGYALVFPNKSPSPVYAEVLELLADCPIAGISLEYEQPRHDPDILRHCGDKHVILGLLDLGTQAVETPEYIAVRIRDALAVVPPARLHPASDCGMWYLPRDVAFGKISALAAGTRIVREELGSA